MSTRKRRQLIAEGKLNPDGSRKEMPPPDLDADAPDWFEQLAYDQWVANGKPEFALDQGNTKRGFKWVDAHKRSNKRMRRRIKSKAMAALRDWHAKRVARGDCAACSEGLTCCVEVLLGADDGRWEPHGPVQVAPVWSRYIEDQFIDAIRWRAPLEEHYTYIYDESGQ